MQNIYDTLFSRAAALTMHQRSPHCINLAGILLLLCWHTMHGMQDTKQLAYRDRTNYLVHAIHNSLMGAVNSIAGLPTNGLTEQRYKSTIGSCTGYIQTAKQALQALEEHYCPNSYTQNRFSPIVQLSLPGWLCHDQNLISYVTQFSGHAITPLQEQLTALQADMGADRKSAMNIEELQKKIIQSLLFWRYAIDAVQYRHHELTAYETSLGKIITLAKPFSPKTVAWKNAIAKKIEQTKLLKTIQAMRTYVANYQGAIYNDLDTAIPTAITPRYTQQLKITTTLDSLYTEWDTLYWQLRRNAPEIDIVSVKKRLNTFNVDASGYHAILHAIRLPLLVGIEDGILQHHIRTLQFATKLPEYSAGWIEKICKNIQSVATELLPDPEPKNISNNQQTQSAGRTEESAGTIMTPRPYHGADTRTSLLGTAQYNIGAVLNNIPVHVNTLAGHVTHTIDRLSDYITAPVQDIGAGINTTRNTLAWIKTTAVTQGSCPEDFLIPPLTTRTFDRAYISQTADDPAIIAVNPACHGTIADTYVQVIKDHFRPYLKTIQTRYTTQKDAATIEHIELTTNPDSNAILFVVAGVKKFQQFCKQTKNIPAMTDQCRLAYHYPEQSIDFLQHHKTTTIDPIIRYYDTVKKIIMQYPVLKEEPPYAQWITTLESLDTIRYLSDEKRRSAIENLVILRAKIYEQVNKKEILYNSHHAFLQKLQRIDIDRLLPCKQDEEKKQADHNALLATLIKNHVIESDTYTLYNHFKAQYSEYTVATPLTKLFAYKAIPRLQKKLADEQTAKIAEINDAIARQHTNIGKIHSDMKSTPFTFLQPFWAWLYRQLTCKKAYFEALQNDKIAAQAKIVYLTQQRHAREQLRAAITKPLQLQSPIETNQLAPGIEGNIDSAIDGAFAAYEAERHTPAPQDTSCP